MGEENKGEEIFKTASVYFPESVTYTMDLDEEEEESSKDVADSIRRQMIADMTRKLEAQIYTKQHEMATATHVSCERVLQDDLLDDIKLLEMLLDRITEERDELAATVATLQQHITELNQNA